MKNILFAIATLLITSPSFASYLESCEFTATVLETAAAPDLGGSVNQYTRLVQVQIDTAVNQGSHAPDACSSRVGTNQWLVSKMLTVASVGQTIKIDYFYVNSLGPDGVVMSERWTVID